MHLFQYWDSAEPPQEIASLVDSYRSLNPTMQHALFSRSSAAAFIDRHFGARHKAAFTRCAIPAMQADYFRYCAVLNKGGFYSVADTRCIGPLEALLPDGAEAILFQRSPEPIVVNDIFGFRHPGNRLLATTLEIATSNIEGQLANNVWITTGPGIFSVLRMIGSMSAAQRAAIGPDMTYGTNSAQPGPGGVTELRVRTLIQACHAIVQRLAVDIDSLFEGVKIGRFPDDVASSLVAQPMSYKDTSRHWTQWPGSIFTDP